MRVVNLSAPEPLSKDKKSELNRLYRQRHFEYTECSCGIILLKSSIHNHLKSKKHTDYITGSIRHSPSPSPT